MTTEVRVGVIAGCVQVLVAVIALIGSLISGDVSRSAARPGTTGTSTTSAASADPTGTDPPAGELLSCPAVYEHYRRIVLADANALATLTTPDTEGMSPLRADPDARRCGLSEVVLQAMR
jgi:hypothetical protein